MPASAQSPLSALVAQQTQSVLVYVVVGVDVPQEVEPYVEVSCHEWFYAAVVAQSVHHHLQGVSCSALAFAVALP